MRFKDGFEIVHVAEEHILVPVGEQQGSFKGVIVLNEAAAFLLEEMKRDITVDEMVQLLISQYDVDENTAKKDIARMLDLIKEHGLLSC